MDNKQPVPVIETIPKIKEFLTKQIKEKVRSGVDFTDLITKLRERKAKKYGKR